MWKYMESAQPTVFVKNYEQGIKRVKKGNYAFLMESTVLDYVVQVNFLFLNLKLAMVLGSCQFSEVPHPVS